MICYCKLHIQIAKWSFRLHQTHGFAGFAHRSTLQKRCKVLQFCFDQHEFLAFYFHRTQIVFKNIGFDTKSSTAPRRNAWFESASTHWFIIVIYICKCKVAVAPTPNAWFCMFRSPVDVQKRCEVRHFRFTETSFTAFHVWRVLKNHCFTG